MSLTHVFDPRSVTNNGKDHQGWVLTLSLFHKVVIGFTKSLQQSLLPKVALESYWIAMSLTHVYDPRDVTNNGRTHTENYMVVTLSLFHKVVIGFTKSLLQSLLLKITRCYKQWQKSPGQPLWVLILLLFHNVVIGFTNILLQLLLPTKSVHTHKNTDN